MYGALGDGCTAPQAIVPLLEFFLQKLIGGII
jgi:hypothetical protein